MSAPFKDGRDFINAAAAACAPWAPQAARLLREVVERWGGPMPMVLAVRAVRGHVAPNWERLPSDLRAAADALPSTNLTPVVGRTLEETIRLLRAARVEASPSASLPTPEKIAKTQGYHCGGGTNAAIRFASFTAGARAYRDAVREALEADVKRLDGEIEARYRAGKGSTVRALLIERDALRAFAARLPGDS